MMTEDTNSNRLAVTNRVAVTCRDGSLYIAFREGSSREMWSITLPRKFARIVCDAIEQAITYCPYCDSFSCDMDDCESSSCGTQGDCKEIEHPSMLEKTVVAINRWDGESTDRTLYVAPSGHHVEEEDLEKFTNNALIRKMIEDGEIRIVGNEPKKPNVDELTRQIEKMGG